MEGKEDMKIYGLCLSNSSNSINKQFLDNLLPKIGGEVIAFEEIDFPLFKMGDDAPENLQALCDKLENADGIIMASPEYNGSFSPFGKNVLDWISTKGHFDGSQKLTCLSGVPTMICSVAPGPLGGIRCIPEVSRVAIELGCVVYQTFATTGGFSGDNYDYGKAVTIAEKFKNAI